jgi:ATP-dependent DNA helicase RecQ
MQKARQILKDVFGYDSFRPLQSDIIQNILNKKDTLVIMPTGGGKSLCYQIPALIFEGLTVVISPLISLMKDQVEQLRQLGVQTALLNSSLPRDVYKNNFESVNNKHAKLLYIAPESIVKPEIANLLSTIKIDCITVDEAHCISEWGHDFRKDYRLLGNFRAKFPDAVCTGLTATATPRVRDDIVKNLNMVRPQKFIASFNRENLFLQVMPKRNSFRQTVDFIKEHPDQSGIIYCFSRKQVDNLSESLSSLGFSAKPYHAGMTDEERNINQDLFIKDEAQIIVATIAFGMGINKSNVRYVLHHDLPKNIESYYQEIGRSGRDGLKADCLLLFSYGDISKINYFIDQKEDEIERQSAKMHLNAMVKYAESEICRRYPLINYFGEPYKNYNCGMCDNCIGNEAESTDITITAQKFLSAVKRTGEIFGANYIIDVLLGTEHDRIINNQHHKLSVYGIGKEYNKKQWYTFVNQFISKELITRDIEFGSLKLSEKANDVLFKSHKVFGFVKEPEAKKFKEVADVNYDRELFEILRRKRKELSVIYEVPPYVIFSDSSLIQMAVDYPVNEEMFLNISGIGRMKLESYGEVFISLIKDYCSKKNIGDRQRKRRKRKRKTINTIADTKPRHIIVSESYNNGKSIDDLAKEYDVKLQTIINHLARYANMGNAIRMDGLLERLTISKEQHQKVFDEFDLTGSFSLKGVYEKFNWEITYEELHILRILYNQNKKVSL